MQTRRRSTGPSSDVVHAVLERARRFGPSYMPNCEVCGFPLTGERGFDWSVHHRRGRDGGDDSHTAPNLLVVHGASNVDRCHGRIHANRGNESRTNGWLITRNGIDRDPLRIPVLVEGESRWTYLGVDATYRDDPPDEP